MRFGHFACAYNNQMFIFGGWNGSITLNDFYSFSFEAETWTKQIKSSGKQPSPRYRHDGSVIENSLFLFGGINQNQERFNDLYEYNFIWKEWSLIVISSDAPSPRTFHKCAIFEDALFIFGGNDGKKLNDTFKIKVFPERINIPRF